MMNRRELLIQSTAAAAGLAVASLSRTAKAAEPPASRIIDTHTHFYDPTRKEGVPWPSKGTSLYRPVYPKDWLEVAEPLGVKETVIVEASEWVEDNAWILALAEKEKCITGFVGHLSPHTPDFAENLKRFAANKVFRGIRVSGATFIDNAEKPEFLAGIKLLADSGIELDLNAPSKAHALAAKIAADFPSLRIVYDHVGSAGDPGKLTAEWREGMKLMGARKNIWLKVSAMQEQTAQSDKSFGQAPRETAFYAPILDHCWECFGADRLIYGSNWPVTEKGGSYADQFKIVSEYFTAKGKDACEKYFWQNAVAAYALPK